MRGRIAQQFRRIQLVFKAAAGRVHQLLTQFLPRRAQRHAGQTAAQQELLHTHKVQLLHARPETPIHLHTVHTACIVHHKPQRLQTGHHGVIIRVCLDDMRPQIAVQLFRQLSNHLPGITLAPLLRVGKEIGHPPAHALPQNHRIADRGSVRAQPVRPARSGLYHPHKIIGQWAVPFGGQQHVLQKIQFFHLQHGVRLLIRCGFCPERPRCPPPF